MKDTSDDLFSSQTCLISTTEKGDDETIIAQGRTANERSTNTEAGYYQVYKRRWYILFQVSLYNFIQTAIAATWSPISISASTAFGFTPRDFVLLADWGVVGLLVFLPIYLWILVKFGLRMTVFSGALCVFVGSGIRCLPLGINQKYAIHVGQFINGVAGCPVMSIGPFVSNTWFPFKERVLATGLMTVSGNLGGILSFLLGPGLVEQPHNTTRTNNTDNTKETKHEIEIYLLVELAITTLFFIMVLTYFPSQPPSPPSRSAAMQRLDFMAGIKALRKNGTFWSMVIMFCTVIASYYAWSGIMPVLYENKGISQTTMGNIGTVTSIGGVIVGIALSWLADRLKVYRSIIWIVCVLGIFLSSLYVVAMSMNWIHVAPFLFSTDALWASLVILGVLVYSVQPLAFEMTADAAYPADEGVATFVLAWLVILTNVVFLSSLGAVKDQDVAFYMVLGCITTSLPFLYFSLDQSVTRIQVDQGS